MEILSDINWTDLCTTLPTLFHGDFVLENILFNKDNFTLLDWRQDFGGSTIAGDIYYDLAKLNHNLIFNHQIVDNNGYYLSINGNDITCDLHRSHNMALYQQRFLNSLAEKGYNINKIQILSSLIWLNMASLHVYPLNKFLFYFGKYNLWRQLSLIK
jgi:thiamine kinase-like enzyme